MSNEKFIEAVSTGVSAVTESFNRIKSNKTKPTDDSVNEANNKTDIKVKTEPYLKNVTVDKSNIYE